MYPKRKNPHVFSGGNQNPLFCFCYLLMASFESAMADTRPVFCVWNDYDCFSAVLFLDVLFRSFLCLVGIMHCDKFWEGISGRAERLEESLSFSKKEALVVKIVDMGINLEERWVTENVFRTDMRCDYFLQCVPIQTKMDPIEWMKTKEKRFDKQKYHIDYVWILQFFFPL